MRSSTCSYVHERSVGSRPGWTSASSDNLTSEQEPVFAAEQRLAGAAAKSELTRTAELNTTAMLNGSRTALNSPTWRRPTGSPALGRLPVA